MAQYLILEDFAGDIRFLTGTTRRDIVAAGTLLDSTVYDISYILGQGCPLILYDAGTMAGALAAFLVQDPGVANVSPDGNLIGLLIAFGAIGGGGAPGTVQEFTFRPTAVTNAPLGVYGTWAELMTAVAAAAAAQLEFVILVDFSTSGASFTLPAGAYDLGGKAILRGVPSQTAFHLQINPFTATIAGIAQIDNGLTVEATGASIAPPITAPAGSPVLRVSRGARIMSSSAGNGPLISVPVGCTLTVILSESSTIDFGTAVAIKTAGAGAGLAVLVGDSSTVADNSISGSAGAGIAFQKGSPAARIPATLSGFAAYPTGAGFTSQLYSLPHAYFGCQTVPLIAGAYFLPVNGNDAIAVATTTDQPFVETKSYGNRLRLLAIAQVSAGQNSGAAENVTVEILVNGVLVPGMTSAVVNTNTLATTPVQLTASNPLLLAVGDKVSARWTSGALTATPIDINVVIETT